MSTSEEGEETKDSESWTPRWAPRVADCGYYSALMSGSIDGTDELPHDHAVVRAMNTTYRPNKQVKGNPEKTLIVAKLSHDTTQEVLSNAFSKFGTIESCRLVRDIVTGRPKGYGFVEFRHSRDMEEAYREGHGMFLDESKITVDYECERLLSGWSPRRFGGGLGGCKGSGQLRFGGRDRPFRKPIPYGHAYFGWKERRESSGRRRSEGQRERSPQRQPYWRDSTSQRYPRERYYYSHKSNLQD